MIDIHSHAIFDVDNGAKTIDQSIKMIKMAKSIGYDAICFTPHYDYDENSLNKKELIEKIYTLKKELISNKIDMHIYLGEEVKVFPNLPDKINHIIALNDSRYILLDFLGNEDLSYIEELIQSLLSMGKIPIFSQPERCEHLQNDFELAKKIARLGALYQIDLNSVVGQYGEKAKELALKLLRYDMVSFVSTNAHSAAGYYKSKFSMQIVKHRIGAEKFKEITQLNPCKALADIPIENWDDKRKDHSTRNNMIVKFFRTFPILERLL